MASFAEASPIPEPSVKRYNERFITGLGTKEVWLNEVTCAEIHKTNGFPLLLEAVLDYEAGIEKRGIIQDANREIAENDQLLRDEVVRFLSEAGDVPDAIRGIMEARQKEAGEHDINAEFAFHSLQDRLGHRRYQDHNQDPLRQFYFSLAYDELAARLTSIDPNYDFAKLVT